MREHVCPRFFTQLRATAEVVGVRVSDDCGVHPLDRNLSFGKPIGERGPRLWTGQSGIYEGDAITVDQGVAIHVAEAWQRDRELQPKNARSDLGDLFGGRLLFLPLLIDYPHLKR